MRNLRSNAATLAVAGLVALSLVVAATGAVTAQQSQTEQGYSISLETPDQLVAQDGQLIGVKINNSGGDSDLFNPIAEIPLPASYSVSQTALDNAYVELENGSRISVRDASLQASTFRSGNAVFLFGENLPQGEIRTYYVNVSVDSPGTTTLEAETRLLYNENSNRVTAQTQKQVTALGAGNITAQVRRPDNTEVTNAEVNINGSSVGSGSVTVERVAGTYDVNATAPDTAPVTLPSFTQTLTANSDATVTYTVPQSLDSPTVVGATQSATVVGGSTSQVTTQIPTAEQSKEVTVSFVLLTSGGTSVIALPDREDIGPVETRTPSVSSGSISATDTSTATNIRVSAQSDVTPEIVYEGYRLGDADKDGQVTSADASTVASTVAALGNGDQYYDVDGDGEITATDAMYIAQYSSGNRSADYTQGDSS